MNYCFIKELNRLYTLVVRMKKTKTDSATEAKNKPHRKQTVGKKADKITAQYKAGKNNGQLNRNPKAFAVVNHIKAQKKFKRHADIQAKRIQLPKVDRNPLSPPPMVVAIVGPKNVGKSTLLRCLVRHFCSDKISSLQGPITLVAGKKRRITFMECPNDFNSMVDIVKVADLVLLMVDASFGFQMEIFEFLSICQVHGFPRVMGVLNHLDTFTNQDRMRRVKKQLKQRFWTEIYKGAKMFYLTRLLSNEEYVKHEVHNLSRFISVMKYKSSSWQETHAHVLVDRIEETTKLNDNIEKTKLLAFGYLRGTYMKQGRQIVHLAGCGDFIVNAVNACQDPCLLPDEEKKLRGLSNKDRKIYAPFSGVGGILYDKDSTYIDLKGSHCLTTEESNISKPIVSHSKGIDESEQTMIDQILEDNEFHLFSSDLNNISELIEINAPDEHLQIKSDKVEEDEMSICDIFCNQTFEQEKKPSIYNYVYHNQEDCSTFLDESYGGLFALATDRPANEFDHNDICFDRFSDDNDICDLPVKKIIDKIRDCFVTGRWSKTTDAQHLLDNDEDVYGDFIDMETGEEHKAGDEVESDTEVVEPKEEKSRKDAIRDKKLMKKQQFDAVYDNVADKDGFYKSLKEEVDLQTELNRNEMENIENAQERVDIYGHSPGSYVRIELDDVPCEFIKNFEPCYPLVLGCVNSVEHSIGVVDVRIRKHRWHKKVIKCRDPIIVSVGWRRFQTIPLLFTQDHNMRCRYLKYTPTNMHCRAIFWGPLTPQNSGVLIWQDTSPNTTLFRIAATGVILGHDKTPSVVKKLKLTGEPLKVFQKTAFIQGMFHSSLEVAKFEGAAIKTVSGIRGLIKASLNLVFLRLWIPIKLPHFYFPVANLLQSVGQKHLWTGLRTLGEIKKDLGLQFVPKENSLYQDVNREEKFFKPLIVPKNLQKELPFVLKKKYGRTVSDPLDSLRPPIIRDVLETKLIDKVKQMRIVSRKREQNKISKRNERSEKYKKQREKEAAQTERKIKELANL
ncbi:hypothetical protein GJ496_001684 [Pomphorhynchus laevis]|nr:hypothetical protein GJ496_001684 [Pomphorhynchus laevis]